MFVVMSFSYGLEYIFYGLTDYVLQNLKVADLELLAISRVVVGSLPLVAVQEDLPLNSSRR